MFNTKHETVSIGVSKRGAMQKSTIAYIVKILQFFAILIFYSRRSTVQKQEIIANSHFQIEHKK